MSPNLLADTFPKINPPLKGLYYIYSHLFPILNDLLNDYTVTEHKWNEIISCEIQKLPMCSCYRQIFILLLVTSGETIKSV